MIKYVLFLYLLIIIIVVPDSLLGILEAFSHKIHGLEFSDRVFLEAGLRRLKGAELGFVRQTILRNNETGGGNH